LDDARGDSFGGGTATTGFNRIPALARRTGWRLRRQQETAQVTATATTGKGDGDGNGGM
jgi:hypothetical protein